MKKTIKKRLTYSRDGITEEIKRMLSMLEEEYPLSTHNAAGCIDLKFIKSPEENLLKITLESNRAFIHYGDVSLAARGIGIILAGIVKEGEEFIEHRPVSQLGMMLDCSRNAVMTVDHFRKWLRRLALMGYNMVMLYTEDTYQMDGERFFGFMRGAYTKKELKAIDAYASQLGIEMIPCIQTLSHLEQVLKLYPYALLGDTPKVIMTEHPESYALIEKMISHWRDCFKSRRIHIGMDEATGIGRGKSLDKSGYRPPFDIFTNHLDKVVKLCEKYEFKPLIWSDMFFRMASKNHDYEDDTAQIPDSVKKQIPAELDLVYWNYNHNDKAHYTDGIARHKALGRTPVIASGIHTWGYFWHDHSKTEKQAGPCIEACVNNEIDELFFTLWGDDGAYCDFNSAMSGLLWCADKVFHSQDLKPDHVEKHFMAICNSSYNACINISRMNLNDFNIARYLLWDDPFLNLNVMALPGIFKNPSVTAILDLLIHNLDMIAQETEEYSAETEAGDIGYIWSLIKLLSSKLQLTKHLFRYYTNRNQATLKSLQESITETIRHTDIFDRAFRTMWLRSNKPFGLEVIQIRNAGLARRVEELRTRIIELETGRIKTIPELTEALKHITYGEEECHSDDIEYSLFLRQYYKSQATSSAIL